MPILYQSPRTGISFTLSSSSYSANEGTQFTVTLTTTGVASDSSIPYTITGVSSSDLSGASLTGNFTINGTKRYGTASTTFTVTADNTTEGIETFLLSLDNGQASVSVTINDTSQASAIQFVNATIYNGPGVAQNVALPSGYQPGDLVVIIDHQTFSADKRSNPSGYTTAFQTGSGLNTYCKIVHYKIIGSDTTCPIFGGTGFTQTALVFRNATMVKSTFDYLGATGGAAATFSPVPAGTTIISASDRGVGSYPTLSSASRSSLKQNKSTYFSDSLGVYMAHPSNVTFSFTDANDAYGTNGLLFQVI